MKPVVKLNFSDFYGGFDPYDNWFVSTLKKRFEIEISAKPDFLIYSCYSAEFLKFNGIRIFYTGENIRPDYRFCDYAFTFDYSEYERHYRLPLYRLFFHENVLTAPKDVNKILQRQSRFCNMIVSNARAKERVEFFHILSDYKKVDSGGRYLNNIGGPVENKREFIRNYAFTFAFENISWPGYTTEKIAEPYIEGSIPLYWGNPLVGEEINPDCFIDVRDFANFDNAAKYILEVYNNENLRRGYIEAPFFKNNIVPENLKEENILNRFEKIFVSKGTIKPVAKSWHKPYYFIRKIRGGSRLVKINLR